MIEADIEEGLSDFLLGFHGDQMADWEKVDEKDIDEHEHDVKFELDNNFNFAPRFGGHRFDDALSMASYLTGASQAIRLANEPSTVTHLPRPKDTPIPPTHAAIIQQDSIITSPPDLQTISLALVAAVVAADAAVAYMMRLQPVLPWSEWTEKFMKLRKTTMMDSNSALFMKSTL